MSRGKIKKKENSVYDLEPICLFITRYKIEPPDHEKTKKAVEAFLTDFKFIRTLNPLVWLFVGRWKKEISNKEKEEEKRITLLVDNLKAVEGNSMVIPTITWTNVLKQHELAWKAWKEIIS